MNRSILRIVDANLNRAREALRVLEDYARFALDHDAWAAELKALRHELVDATAGVARDAIHHRDTPGDVGADNKAPSELTRRDLAHVVTAASKRLGEALRSVEECLKTLDPAAAARVERTRYAFYDVELRLARTLRASACAVAGARFSDVRLYVLVTESLCAGRPWLQVVSDAIGGGADCIQLREKSLESGELLRRARQLAELCRDRGVISIINDRPDVALLSGADGVHLGQGDLPVREARKLVGDDLIVGASTHAIEQARAAMLDGADYLGVGPVFPSTTKPRDILPGLDYARAAAAAVNLPCIAIAGITADNAREVMSTGVSGVAVSSAVIAAPDVRAATARLKAAVMRARPAPQDSPAGQTLPPAAGFQPDPSDQPRAPVHRQRHLAHWIQRGPVYFVTFRLLSGTLSDTERQQVLDHIRQGDRRFYHLFGCVVMPDHVHVLLQPISPYDMPRITKGIKGASARIINEMRRCRANLWQDESFDRMVRDDAELERTADDMYRSPVRAGLCNDPESWPARYFNLNPH